jgi:hypothetical protein
MMSRILASKAETFPRTADGRTARSGPVGAKAAATSLTNIASTDARTDWRLQLAQELPDFFHSLPLALEIGNLRCGPGWRDIIERTCFRIAASLHDRESFRFERITERNGTLRIYWGGRLSARSEAAVRAAVDLAEARSLCVCELCGAEGRLHRDGGILSTRCSDHAQGEPVPVRPDLKNVHLTQRMVAGRQWTVVIRRYDPLSDAFIDVDPADVEDC